MSYQISEATKSHTTKCPYKFECLDKDKWNTCSIDEELHGGLAVKNKCNQKFCSYSLYFSSSRYFCICPTRCEIYKHYKK